MDLGQGPKSLFLAPLESQNYGFYIFTSVFIFFLCFFYVFLCFFMFYLGFLTLEPIFRVKYNENGALGSLWESTGGPQEVPTNRIALPRTPHEQSRAILFVGRPQERPLVAQSLKIEFSHNNCAL